MLSNFAFNVFIIKLKKFPMYEPQKDIDGISINPDKGFFPSSIYLITK